MARAYINHARGRTATPQSQPIPGRETEMVSNNAGGFGFVLDDWERLSRFLILGSEGGSYYVGEQKLTAQNAAVVVRCLKLDGPRVVEMAREINVNNRAPKVDQQLFTLALAMKHGDLATKAAVALAAPAMLRTGTHLLHFVAMLDSLGGWNRSKRRLIAAWFAQDVDRLAFQVLKYGNRDGWTQRDVLRVTHAKAASDAHNAVLAWVCRANAAAADDLRPVLPKVLQDHATMGQVLGGPIAQALYGVERGLPREALPTEALGDRAVQEALLPAMPLHALIRNLGNLTAAGLFDNGAHDVSVAKKLTDKAMLRRARVHPFAVLLATLVYKNGRGARGAKTWVPNTTILSALEDAYDLAFDNVTPTGKRLLIGVDISASMGAVCVGSPIAASTAAVSMAVTLARLEPHATVVQFDTAVQRVLPITRRTAVSPVLKRPAVAVRTWPRLCGGRPGCPRPALTAGCGAVASAAWVHSISNSRPRARSSMLS